MRAKSFRLFLLLVTLLLAVGLAGCGGDDDDEGQATQAADTGEGEGASGGTLVFGSSADPVVLDFALISDGESYRVNLQIYDTLIQQK